MSGIADWTNDVDALSYQHCAGCARIWYFHRAFCPRCGSESLQSLVASGRGTIYAITIVTRAPTPEFQAHTPYAIALTDAQEGFRFMAHAAPDLAIGDPVLIHFRDIAGRRVPYCIRR